MHHSSPVRSVFLTLLGAGLGASLIMGACSKDPAPTQPPEPSEPASPPAASEKPAEPTPPSEPEEPAGPDPAELVRAQISAGNAVYEEHCGGCHGGEGQGKKGKVPPVYGDGGLPLDPRKGARLRRGPFESAQDVFDFVKEAMPPKKAGELTDEEYYAVVATLLLGNGIELDEPLDAETAPETAPQLPDDEDE